MKSFFAENKNRIVKTITVLLFPFIGCLLYCFIRGTSLFKLYLPSSYNNDVLFYYKLVEGMVNGGITGYFGFNESHALYGGFAAWNPLIVMPWFLWGILFGWGFMSLIACNIVIFSAALGIFAMLVNPKWKSIATAMVVFLLFPGLWIHLMNGLPEIIIASNLIVFSALMINYSENKKSVSLWIAIILAAFLTIARPYMVVFHVYALICLVLKKRWYNYVAAASILGVTGLSYVLTNHYLTAAYFEPLYDISLIKAVMGLHLKDAYYILGAAVKNTVPGVLRFLGGAFLFGSTAGTQYIISLLGIVFAIVWIVTGKRKDRKNTGIYASYAIAGISLFTAIIILLGKPNEGGRHCFAFSILAILLLSLTVDNLFGWISNGIIVGLLVIFMCRGALVPTDYDIPMPNGSLEQEIEYWQAVMPSNGSSGYDNTIIWALSDTVNGNGALTDYHCLYAVPAKMGISCCNYSYLMENIGSLKSRYIAVIPGGYFEEQLRVLGYNELGHTNRLGVYMKP